MFFRVKFYDIQDACWFMTRLCHNSPTEVYVVATSQNTAAVLWKVEDLLKYAESWDTL